MNAKFPPTLAYFLIYNPAITPNAERDNDEDAREESHILFYTSQDQVTSRDKMLRQAGLAKAIANFSELFTLSRDSDNIHTQSKRMISISPEPDFWMHICVNLARTPKSHKKSKEASATTYYYHQESVPDTLLRDCLLQGYEEFKLFHGALSSKLPSGRLQLQLERFFTPWAWKLDFDSSDNMYYRSGPHVHPSNSSLRSIAADFAQTLPPDSLPVLLTSSQLVTFPGEYEYPSSLLKYLWSVSRCATSETNVEQGAQKPKPENLSSDIRNNDDNHTTNSSFFGPGFGNVMNMKKWTWPGSLTFGGTVGSETPQHATPASSVIAMPDSDTVKRSKSEAKVTSSPKLDQSALDDVNEALNCHCAPAKENAYMPLIPENSDTSNPLPLCSGSTTSFTSKSIFLSDLHTLDPQRRQLFYISVLHSVFALVIDVSWSQEKEHDFLKRLLFNTVRFLKKIRETLERDKYMNMTKSRRSDYILRFQPNLTYADGNIAKEGISYLNENSILMQDDEIQELFSRPQMPKAWFVSKRPDLGASNRTYVEANFAVNIKEASLIGANNEIESVMRHFSKLIRAE